MSEVVCELSWYCWHSGQIILCCGAVLCIGRCLAAALASTHEKPIVGDRWHTQNIQLNNVIGENQNGIICFMEKAVQIFCNLVTSVEMFFKKFRLLFVFTLSQSVIVFSLTYWGEIDEFKSKLTTFMNKCSLSFGFFCVLILRESEFKMRISPISSI